MQYERAIKISKIILSYKCSYNNNYSFDFIIILNYFFFLNIFQY